MDGKDCFQRSFEHKSVTCSTNDDVKKKVYASSQPVYAAVSADAQTGGRGRLGRTFCSPGGGLYFSFSVPLTGKEKNIPFLTLTAGLAAAQTLIEYGFRPLVKWPNDLYFGNKKAAGILVELLSNGKFPTAVVGIGINLLPVSGIVPAEIKNRVTSLSEQGPDVPEKEKLMREIITLTDSFVYGMGVLDGNGRIVAEKIRALSYLTGKTVRFGENGAGTGVFTSVSDSGEALVVSADGRVISVSSGEILTFFTDDE